MKDLNSNKNVDIVNILVGFKMLYCDCHAINSATRKLSVFLFSKHVKIF